VTIVLVAFAIVFAIRLLYVKMPLHIDTGFYVSNWTVTFGNWRFAKGWSARFAGASKAIPEAFYTLVWLATYRTRIPYKIAMRLAFTLALGVGALAMWRAGEVLGGFGVYAAIALLLLATEPHYGGYYENCEQFHLVMWPAGLAMIALGLTAPSPFAIGMGAFIFALDTYWVKYAAAPVAAAVYFTTWQYAPAAGWPIAFGWLAATALHLAWMRANGVSLSQAWGVLRIQQRMLGMRRGKDGKARTVGLEELLAEKARFLRDIFRQNSIIPVMSVVGMAAGIVVRIDTGHLPAAYGLPLALLIGGLIEYVMQRNRVWYYALALIPGMALLAGGVIGMLELLPAWIGGSIFGFMLGIWLWRAVMKPARMKHEARYRWIWKLHPEGGQVERNLAIEALGERIRDRVRGERMFVFTPENQLYAHTGASYPTSLVSAVWFLEGLAPEWPLELGRAFRAAPPRFIVAESMGEPEMRRVLQAMTGHVYRGADNGPG
jgi:hypothetical protein